MPQSMTVVKYIRDSGVATSIEIMKFGKDHPADWAPLKEYAKNEMRAAGIVISGE